MEDQPVDGFDGRPLGQVAVARDTANLDPGALRTLEYGARAKGITAVQRQ